MPVPVGSFRELTARAAECQVSGAHSGEVAVMRGNLAA